MYGSAENRYTGKGVHSLVIGVYNEMKLPESPPHVVAIQ
jgi:hypothetical protein